MVNKNLELAAALLRKIKDFPKEGILFWDIQPLLRDHKAKTACIEALYENWRGTKIDVVAAFDARGFIFGSSLADTLRVGCEQIRKPGKLPGKTAKQSYSLEYREADTLEMIDDGYLKGKRVLLVDDVLATGGTALAGCQLVEKLGGIVVGVAVVIELPFLGGRGLLSRYAVQSLISVVEGKPLVGVDYTVDGLATPLGHPETLVMVERLNEPEGLAFPGGHIYPHEPAETAIIREVREETGLVAQNLKFLKPLVGLNRDHRGVKVSLLFTLTGVGANHYGESGKTKVRIFDRDALRKIKPKQFVFDVYEVLKKEFMGA